MLWQRSCDDIITIYQLSKPYRSNDSLYRFGGDLKSHLPVSRACIFFKCPLIMSNGIHKAIWPEVGMQQNIILESKWSLLSHSICLTSHTVSTQQTIDSLLTAHNAYIFGFSPTTVPKSSPGERKYMMFNFPYFHHSS